MKGTCESCFNRSESLRVVRSYIEEGFIWHVFTHIYLALRECHRHREGNVVRPILHRDIKPGNIFLDNNVCGLSTSEYVY